MPTIVLADDHAMVRQGLRAILEAEPDFDVVGEAGDGLTAVEMAAKLRPAVLITDIVMPKLSGLDVVAVAAQRAPSTRVVVVSMHNSAAYVSQALRNGASAYVLKDAGYSDLVRAVRAAAAGRRYLSPPLSEQSIESYLRETQEGEVDLYDTLSAREREVLHLAGEGATAPQIGERLGISARTVEAHRAHVMQKLGLRSKAELIRYMVQRGLQRPDPAGA
jgi:DNA-binding NarL/FixJ family response regulator